LEVDVTVLDWTLIVIVAFFFIRGLFRGFLLELFDLLALLAGYIAARFGGPILGKILADTTPLSRWVGGIVAAIILFIAFTVLVGWIAKLLRKAAKAVKLGGFDRFLGSLFGIMKASVIILVLMFLISITPAGRNVGKVCHKGSVSSWYWLGSQLFREAVKAEPLAPTQSMAKWLRSVGINDEAVHIITDRPDLMLAILDHARKNDIKIPVDQIMDGEIALNAKEIAKFSEEKQQEILKILENSDLDLKDISKKFWDQIVELLPN